MGRTKKSRIALLLSAGGLIAIAIAAYTHHSLEKNRYVTNAEIHEQARLAYLEENGAYLKRLSGPVRKLSSVDEIYQEAATAVSAELVRMGESPDDYRVRVFEEEDAMVFDFAVLHVDGFQIDSTDRLGNRSGKDRWISYDVRLGRVVHNSLQQ